MAFTGAAFFFPPLVAIFLLPTFAGASGFAAFGGTEAFDDERRL